jgi:hypothetical protein
LRQPNEHFSDIEAIMQKHATALEAEIRALQKADETAQWSNAWKRTYNLQFATSFARQKIFRNWAADAEAWGLLPDREYPNKGNHKSDDS